MVSLNGQSTIIAHYFPKNEDSDSDGVADWYEFNQFGNLAQKPSDDPDRDGYPNSQESALGQEATIVDEVADGGISSRDTISLLYFQSTETNPNQAPVITSNGGGNTANLSILKTTQRSQNYPPPIPMGTRLATLSPADWIPQNSQLIDRMESLLFYSHPTLKNQPMLIWIIYIR